MLSFPVIRYNINTLFMFWCLPSVAVVVIIIKEKAICSKWWCTIPINIHHVNGNTPAVINCRKSWSLCSSRVVYLLRMLVHNSCVLIPGSQFSLMDAKLTETCFKTSRLLIIGPSASRLRSMELEIIGATVQSLPREQIRKLNFVAASASRITHWGELYG
jgi:hypothetical protein